MRNGKPLVPVMALRGTTLSTDKLSTDKLSPGMEDDMNTAGIGTDRWASDEPDGLADDVQSTHHRAQDDVVHQGGEAFTDGEVISLDGERLDLDGQGRARTEIHPAIDEPTWMSVADNARMNPTPRNFRPAPGHMRGTRLIAGLLVAATLACGGGGHPTAADPAATAAAVDAAHGPPGTPLGTRMNDLPPFDEVGSSTPEGWQGWRRRGGGVVLGGLELDTTEWFFDADDGLRRVEAARHGLPKDAGHDLCEAVAQDLISRYGLPPLHRPVTAGGRATRSSFAGTGTRGSTATTAPVP